MYDNDRRKIAGYNEPGETNTSYLVPWLDEGEAGTGRPVARRFLRQPAIRRRSAPICPSSSLAGMSTSWACPRTGFGQNRRRRLAHSAGAEQSRHPHPFRGRRLLAAFPPAQPRSLQFLPAAVARHRAGVLHQRVAGHVSVQTDHPAGVGAGRRHGPNRRRRVRAARGVDCHRRKWQSWCARSTTWPPTWRPAANWRRRSSAQLTAANQALEGRRRELETILETIPSGVVTLDSSGKVLLANRAFSALMGLRSNDEPGGKTIDSLLPPEWPMNWAP